MSESVYAIHGQIMLPIVGMVPLQWAPINATGSGDNTVIAAVTGKVLRVVHIWFNAALAVGVSFKSGNNTKVESMLMATNGFFEASGLPNGWVVQTNAGEAFVLNNSLAVNVRGGLLYVEL